jgi:hypothetical protein
LKILKSKMCERWRTEILRVEDLRHKKSKVGTNFESLKSQKYQALWEWIAEKRKQIQIPQCFKKSVEKWKIRKPRNQFIKTFKKQRVKENPWKVQEKGLKVKTVFPQEEGESKGQKVE